MVNSLTPNSNHTDRATQKADERVFRCVTKRGKNRQDLGMRLEVESLSVFVSGLLHGKLKGFQTGATESGLELGYF